MSVIVGLITAIVLTLTGQGQLPEEDDPLVYGLLQTSVDALEEVCSCEASGTYEHYGDSVLIGAVAYDTPVSASFLFEDGIVTFAISEP